MFSNQIYDMDTKEHFKVTMKENRDRWYQEAPEPLWIKTGRLGIRTCMYWPWFVNFGVCSFMGSGSEGPSHMLEVNEGSFQSPYSTGKYLHRAEDFQTFMHKYEGDTDEFQKWIDSKVSEIVELLKDPCDQFIIVYWGTLDEISHKYGPRAPETLADLKLADTCLLHLQVRSRFIERSALRCENCFAFRINWIKQACCPKWICWWRLTTVKWTPRRSNISPLMNTPAR